MHSLKFIEEFASGRQMASQTLPLRRDLWFDVNRLRIHCLKAGSRGRTVLILHGGGLDAAGLSFRKTIPVLAEHHRVFAPDWPGFGQSDPMPITWRVEECVDFVGELLDALGLMRTSLVGVSMGGAFALGFALRAPERVERLVLVDSAGLGNEIPGGLLSYFKVRLPLLDELSWALLVGSRTLARRTLCAALANREQVLSEDMLDEIIRLSRRAGAGARVSSVTAQRIPMARYADELSGIDSPRLKFQHFLCTGWKTGSYRSDGPSARTT